MSRRTGATTASPTAPMTTAMPTLSRNVCRITSRVASTSRSPNRRDTRATDPVPTIWFADPSTQAMAPNSVRAATWAVPRRATQKMSVRL